MPPWTPQNWGHELYLRMGRREALRFAHPAQFFPYAARAMRHLLINRARDRRRLCAGGQWMRVTLDDRDLKLALDTAEQALALDAALKRRPGAGHPREKPLRRRHSEPRRRGFLLHAPTGKLRRRSFFPRCRSSELDARGFLPVGEAAELQR
ncbi:MAG TPA: ECF-type sigma factor [Rhodanobacter sp.]